MHGYIIILFQALNGSGFSVEGAVTAAFTVPQCQVCQQTHANTQNLTHTHCTPVPGMPTNTCQHKILHIPIVPQCQVYQQTHANAQNLTHTRCTPVPGIPANTCQHTKSYTYLLYPSARYANKHMPIHKILQVPIITQSRVCPQTCPLQHNLTHTHPYRLTVRFPVLGYSTPVTEKCIFWFPPSKTHGLRV